MTGGLRAGLVLLFPALLVPVAARSQAPTTSCTSCHGDADSFGEEGELLVMHSAEGIHAEVGLGCHDCHGGNPDPALADDMEAAMDPAYPPNPFLGTPARMDVPSFCGRCHSDPNYMRRFGPDFRVDQVAEYWTSRHGRALLTGDPRVATCVDCHGVHGILAVDDTKSPVFPTEVAETCRSCHEDPERMSHYRLPDGRPLPVDQYAKWRRSVHAAALLDKEDLTAPTCNDCHGNHGAAPPGVESVGFVCGQCHGREAELFRRSPKHEGFVRHNEFLTEDPTITCADCHEPPEPQAEVTGLRSFTECATCHENHAVVRPTIALLGSLPETPCAFCHEGPEPAAEDLPEPRRIRENYARMRDALLAQAQEEGREGLTRFDWLVDQALSLPSHTLGSEGEEGPVLRPEFGRLFRKFRIGKATYTYFDPVTEQEVQAPVMTCARCHGPEPVAADSPVGWETAAAYLNGMRELTLRTASAERTLLDARRGGVELKGGLLDLDKAVDNQIELEVLVHTFHAGEGSPFAEKNAEGLEHAEAALQAGQTGLAEISHRRQGLYIALAFILLTLIGLGAKIRSLSRDGA